MFSAVVNLRKDLRNFVTYDSKPLVAIDVKNCQPYMVNLILQPEFWAENSTLPVSINTLPENVRSEFAPGSKIMRNITAFLQSAKPEYFAKYRAITTAPDAKIYEEIADVANKLLAGNSAITRDQAKTAMFYVLFSSNRGQSDDWLRNTLKEIFTKKMFPVIGEFFRIIKATYKDSKIKRHHSRLAVLLQNIESQIILHICCRRIWEESDGIVPLLTIHDSIVTTAEHMNYVKEVMREELTRCIGFEPILVPEKWNCNNKNINKAVWAAICKECA